MKKLTPLILSALLAPGFLAAQGVSPISSTQNQPLGTVTEARVSAETQAILEDRRQRDRAADLEAAMQLKNEAEAQLLVDSILADANAAAIIAESDERARHRLAEAERTEEARTESIAYLSRRLRGEAAVTEAPASFRSRYVVEDPATGTAVVRSTQPRYYNDNHRVVTYRSMSEVPPVLIASSRMNRIQVQQVAESPYATSFAPVERRPAEYIAPEAYAVSYAVDPNSQVTRDDILFVQGSTAFKDAYSYDLVQDLAMAISDPSLAGQSFVIEGHASAEGDYNENLALSQARAERIAREIVGHGVSTSRLIPVGYGENEATYPTDSADELRALDRRVAVYRLKPTVTVSP
ncbi:MAG: OmpA family protein [Verrucomicrobiales bacterium]